MKPNAPRGSAEPIGWARWFALAVLLGAAVALAPATVGADGIYRCTGADGKTVFTSDPSACLPRISGAIFGPWPA